MEGTKVSKLDGLTYKINVICLANVDTSCYLMVAEACFDSYIEQMSSVTLATIEAVVSQVTLMFENTLYCNCSQL